MQKLNILIIEDHPQIAESFKLGFSKIYKNQNRIYIENKIENEIKNINSLWVNSSLPDASFTQFAWLLV